MARPNRIANDKLRGREHLTEAEVGRLEKVATQGNRHGFRDATMIMMAFRHGLRVTELCDLRWDQVDLGAGKLHVRRVKNSAPSTHVLDGKEIRALRRLQREQPPGNLFVFTTERGAPFTTAGFRKMLARLGVGAKIGFPIHPHMLRHGTGFKLANDGVDTRAIQDYLGHKSIANTVRYSRLSPERFKGFWWKD
jgi:type 1 fimbriae regulatory protein FimB/type 1 fimbriae regulatory protein FimE